LAKRVLKTQAGEKREKRKKTKEKRTPTLRTKDVDEKK